jgi:hypothetical protein
MSVRWTGPGYDKVLILSPNYKGKECMESTSSNPGPTRSCTVLPPRSVLPRGPWNLMRTSLLWIQPRLFVGVGVRLVFRLQESTYLQQLSQLHKDSNLDVLLLHGKITKSSLKRIQPHVDTLSESVTITDFIQRCILSTVSLFLYAFIDDSENRLLPNNVMMIRNYGGDKDGLKERRGGAKEQQR